MSPTYRRRLLRAALGIGITIAFLWLVLRSIDIPRVVGLMTQVPWYTIPVSLLFLTAGYSVRVVRWWWMLRSCDPQIKLGACVRPLLVSVAINNVVPLRVGDAVRVMGFKHELRAPAVRIAASLLIERFLDMTVLFMFLLVGFLHVEHTASSVDYSRILSAVGIAIVLAWTTLLLLGKRMEMLLRLAVQHRALKSRGWSERLEPHLNQLMLSFDILRAPSRALGLLLISALVWSFEGAVFQTVAHSLSYNGQWYGPWFAFASGTFATLLPSSPGYIGTFDFFAMSGLAAYGATRSMSAAFAFLVHAVLWVPLTAAGSVYLLLPKPSGRDIDVAKAPKLGRNVD